MPVKKAKRKKRIHYRDNQKITHSLDLLNSRALMSLANYLESAVDDRAHASMEQLFRDYKKHKKAIHTALISAFRFLTKEQYIPDPDDPPCYKLPEGPPPSKKLIKKTKKHINRIARKVWKK